MVDLFMPWHYWKNYIFIFLTPDELKNIFIKSFLALFNFFNNVHNRITVVPLIEWNYTFVPKTFNSTFPHNMCKFTQCNLKEHDEILGQPFMPFEVTPLLLAHTYVCTCTYFDFDLHVEQEHTKIDLSQFLVL